jgi:hypothetical protein
MNEERMLKPALVGGVLLGILSSLPVVNLFNCFCCAWVICGGVLASYLYVKDSPVPVTLGRGALVGLLAGIFGTIVSALFSIPLSLLLKRAGMGTTDQLRQALAQVPNLPPETREMLRTVFARESMDVFFFVLGTVFMLVTYCLVAMLGGTIGVAIFEKRKPHTEPVTIPEPPATLPPPPPPDAE